MTDVVDDQQTATEDVGTTGPGGFDITPFIPLIALGVVGAVVFISLPTITNITRELTQGLVQQVRGVAQVGQRYQYQPKAG